ncbi:hypothetical protein ACEQ6A_11335 [Rhizobium brockwellii]|uniref:hypothetical protein n=1 Tax=Rhizobium brockwellii TaxID=3019932 RepID=UPI003F96121C
MGNHFEEHPRLAYATAGAIIGTLAGLLLIGNLGIARGGGAIAVSGWLIGMLIGGYVGFRIGEGKLRRLNK